MPRPHHAAQALKDNEARWNQEYAAKDKIADHYTENAILMPPGVPSTSGKAAIHKMLADMMAGPGDVSAFSGGASGSCERRRAGVQPYQMTMTDPHANRVVSDHGSYLSTYVKQPDGSWKAVADIATSDTPAPAMAAASSK